MSDLASIRYRWLRRRGYRPQGIVDVRHIDDLFSDPPVEYKRSSKLVMCKGLSTRTLRFRGLTADQLDRAIRTLEPTGVDLSAIDHKGAG